MGANKRNKWLAVFAGTAIAVSLVVVALVALTSGSDTRSETTGGAGGSPRPEATAYYFTAKAGEGQQTRHAMLEMNVGPSGQVTGNYVLYRFGENDGEPVKAPAKQFGGTTTDGHFELVGLSDSRVFKGSLQNGVLKLDGTIGSMSDEWQQIGSAGEFDTIVRETSQTIKENCPDAGSYHGCADE